MMRDVLLIIIIILETYKLFFSVKGGNLCTLIMEDLKCPNRHKSNKEVLKFLSLVWSNSL